MCLASSRQWCRAGLRRGRVAWELEVGTCIARPSLFWQSCPRMGQSCALTSVEWLLQTTECPILVNQKGLSVQFRNISIIRFGTTSLLARHVERGRLTAISSHDEKFELFTTCRMEVSIQHFSLAEHVRWGKVWFLLRTVLHIDSLAHSTLRFH